ncbi:MAG TPA: DUF2235 domain-containing protein, partial [Legionellaceae bacterium]|nr:DUF2235 domain-containing protein [Legionellaceae bacterium]
YYDATVINTIYNLYRSKLHRDGAGLPTEIGQCFFPVPIKFLGVFDTVKALPENCDFHDIDLHEQITMARHALAIDEHRIDYKPCMWKSLIGNINDNPEMPRSQQMWFVGAHSDIGGGYGGEEETGRGLANVALHWMLGEAKKLGGIAYNDDSLALYIPAPIVGEIHDEFSTVGDSTIYIKPVDGEGGKNESYFLDNLYSLRGRVYRHICSKESYQPHQYYPVESQGRQYGLLPNTHTLGTATLCEFNDTALSKEAEERLLDGAGRKPGNYPYHCSALFESTLGNSLFSRIPKKLKRLNPCDGMINANDPAATNIFIPGTLFASTSSSAEERKRNHSDISTTPDNSNKA